MILIAVTGGVAVLITALWFSPWRDSVLRGLPCLHRYAFTCKVSLLVDETKSFGDDTTFCVQMLGRVPVPSDGTDTNVCVEAADITDSRQQPEPVLSTDERFRLDGEAGFYFAAHNGVIPKKNTVIFPWKTVCQIPAQSLRYARRGRRRLLFKVSILSAATDQVLAADQAVVEYVSHRDGFLDLQSRKLDVLRASVELAVGLGAAAFPPASEIRQMIGQWLQPRTQLFPAARQAIDWMDAADAHAIRTVPQAIDCLMGFAEQTEKLAAIELAVQVCSAQSEMTADRFTALSEAAESLQIRKGRFLALCQKILLFSECRLQTPALLLGIDETMDQEAFRRRLNEEYRKWNARVTHPDEQIRRRADGILSLIAELRSRRMAAQAGQIS